MSVLISHPTGNSNVRNALKSLHSAKLLSSYHTTIATFDRTLWHKLSHTKLGAEFNRRRYDESLSQLTQQHPCRELGRILSQKFNFGSFYADEHSPCSVQSVYQDLDRKCSKRIDPAHLQAVYAYEDGAEDSFRTAKQQGLKCIYDLPIGYWRAARRIQTEEAERQPDWAMTMPALQDSPTKCERKDQELQLADTIIVASKFTAQTLKEAPFELPAPTIIPYGCPSELAEEHSTPHPDKPLKVLYIGSLSQRKGIAYLLEAAKQLGNAIELTIVGKRVADCKPLDAALQQYRWIESLSHSEILQLMHEHDVFVFPSLFEGFGLVLTEALSQGLPIIATSHTCAPDIIEDGREGFIIPIRDAHAIASKLEYLNSNREELTAMKANALQCARKTTWEQYRQSLARTVQATLRQQ